ncbi:hypothetical protein PPL_08221 [Heterostelium album PN500]|uniref:Uncharacterized protein n=1 Tax=Heterostelium pallidum (strain ATCC 26659 / Pp 5 / PN500) TaxID=670386 RepID=D3BIY6_HETP5|nr:hypothetical protein PPL_08221 [Heterostelium album PN500]EFA78760.1 hypothetical protein PPL_08221 [Heterostelium album PN500]|eukprot:XP_020430884.1 hypothetical protein PPL_08221 [Heterostelium album PN500]
MDEKGRKTLTGQVLAPNELTWYFSTAHPLIFDVYDEQNNKHEYQDKYYNPYMNNNSHDDFLNSITSSINNLNGDINKLNNYNNNNNNRNLNNHNNNNIYNSNINNYYNYNTNTNTKMNTSLPPHIEFPTKTELPAFNYNTTKPSAKCPHPYVEWITGGFICKKCNEVVRTSS